MSEFNKYEKEQFAELHKRFANPLYIFCFAFIPLIILKFSKKPGDNLLLPITLVSVFAFLFQIIQITVSNLTIDNSNLVFANYMIPLVFLSFIVALIILDKTKFIIFKNVK